jgi:hypothetical protein
LSMSNNTNEQIIENDENDENEQIIENDENEQNDENDENNPHVSINNSFVINPLHNDISNLINERVDEIMNYAYINTTRTEPHIIDFIEMCYLRCLEYDDCDISITISYTIKNAIETCGLHNIELNDLCANIFGYSLLGTNYVFIENFDMISEIMIMQLRRYIRRVYGIYVIAQFMAGMDGMQTMEDVKMILSQDEINKLPLKKYIEVDENLKNTNNICTICRDDYQPDDDVRILTCNHIYHMNCIDSWFNSHSNKCPHCRTEIGVPTPKN